MSADIAEFSDAMFGEDGFMEEIGSRPVDDAVVNDAFDNIRNKFDFTKNFSRLEIGPDGNITALDGEKVIDFSAAKGDFSAGEFEDAYKKLGIDVSEPGVRDFINQQDTAFEQTTKGQEMSAARETTEAGVKTAEKVPIPKTQAELEEISRKNNIDIDKANKDYAELRKEVTEAKTPEEAEEKVKEKTSSWKSKLVISLAALVGIIKIYEDIKGAIEHIEHANSGCFMYPPQGSRCKIDAMTCNQDDLDAAETVCSPCSGTKCFGEWLPAKTADFCGCNTPLSDTPFSGYSSQAVTGTNPCTGGNNLANCPKKSTKETYNPLPIYGQNIPFRGLGDPQQIACPNVSGCMARVEACAGGSRCSPWCDSKNNVVLTTTGQHIQCESCNFWCAAQSLMPDIFSWPSSLIGQIEKILLWICIGIAVVAVVYFVGKEVIHWLFSKKESDGKDIKVNITPVIKEAKAGFRHKK